MVLVLRCEPIERVADAVFPIGMCAEVDDLVERLFGNGNPPQPGTPAAPALEFLRGHVNRPSTQCGVDHLLPPLIASIQPDGHPSPWLNQSRNRIEDGPRVGVMMHHPNGKNEVK